MTLSSFVAKSAFRNRRRSLLTVASIAFSLLLLCIMLCVWRSFYIDKGAPDSALRIMTRHKVSLANFLPIYYREKIRSVPGVVHVVPMTWFGGKYKDDKPENFFAQFATDPDEYFEVAADKIRREPEITQQGFMRLGRVELEISGRVSAGVQHENLGCRLRQLGGERRVTP